MDDISDLKSRVSALQQLVDSLVVQMLQNDNANMPMVGGDIPIMPVLGEGDANPGCYDIEEMENGTATFANPYYSIGGKVYVGPTQASECTNGVVALKISASGQQGCQIEVYGSVADMISEQSDVAYYIIPLYQFDEEDNVVCDFRNMCNASMGEF